MSWIRTFAGTSSPGLKLFCLPHAGGNPALFRGWRALLPVDIELNLICYPGRLDRWQQPVPDSMAALVQAVTNAMAEHIDGEWAIFGHSMGAVVAHEAVTLLAARGVSPPTLLAVSAREAPQFHLPGSLHAGSDEARIDELMRLGGTDPALLAMPEMRGLILPALRADYALIERWRPDALRPVACPIAAFVGSSDPELDDAQARGWSEWTTARFTLDCFAGGHFYFSPDPQPLIERLRARLDEAQDSGRAR